jgi:hypothetical protein
MLLSFTPLMKKRLTPRAHDMIEKSLRHFPELDGKTITIGYTRAHLGSASLIYERGKEVRLVIRLKVRKLSYQTIGHELTHLVQGLSHGDRLAPASAHGQRIPSGEKQCDIWTLARHELFCDDAPTYLHLPRGMRECWTDYAKPIRKLCIAAIKKRQRQRFYICWLESEIRNLGRHKRPAKNQPSQLFLSFMTEPG